ncbi:hypothetical protein WR25_26481 [Diploscapter pachys]|uniref:VWFA domain-containing protein n=1 Tax=Diploscapter pachys TaxID=2018661 RepID=A0A2A2KRM7_9BILA|nr:hypothetical protein WR25_26481 [Diploscapter pachys]
MVINLTSNWTPSQTGLRVATIGLSIANEVSYTAYLTTYQELFNNLDRMRKQTTQFGLYPATFSEIIGFIYDYYVKDMAYFPARKDVMKRILMFTTLSNKNDIQSQAAKTRLIKDAGFELTIVGIGIDKSLYDGIAYHKFIPMTMSQLSHYTEAFLDELVNDGICFWDNGWPTTPAQICTTSTSTPKPTTTPTTKPASTVKTVLKSDHLEFRLVKPRLHRSQLHFQFQKETT